MPCTAYKTQDATCGSATGVATSVAPTQNLCGIGSGTVASLITDVVPESPYWEWICQ